MRKNFLSTDSAMQTMIKSEKFMEGREYFVQTEKIFELINKSNLSAYDCEFVSLAKDLNIPLITSDKKNSYFFSGYSNPATYFCKLVEYY
ncbi:MAG: hypothetical protein M3R36_03265 [Bacteroidota bacterium]|nr:hypothetical protein [Bacteroidota bacterium]